MSEKDEQQYYLLNFTHEELAGLLYKIKHNEVLTTEQYDKLINEIGLDNISTFDLDFYKLKNRPIEVVRTSQLLNDNNFIDVKQLQELVDEHITPSIEELDRINAEIDILKSVNIDDITSEIENIRNNIESMTQTLEGLQDYTIDYTTTLANIYDTVNELNEDTQLLFNNDESFKLLHDTIIQNLTGKQTDINIIFNLLDEIKVKGNEINSIIAQIEEAQNATTEFANMFKDEYEYDAEGNSTLVKAGINSRLAFLEKCYGETLGANDYATAGQVAEYIDVVNNALDMLNDKTQDIEANEKAIISIYNLFDEYVDHIKIIQNDYSLIKAYYDNVVIEYKETQKLVNDLTFIVNSLDLDSINGIDNIRDSINAFNTQLQNYVLKIDYESKISSIESRLLNLESSLTQVSDNLKILNSIDHTSFLLKDEFNNQKNLLSQNMLIVKDQLAALRSDLNAHINNFENHTHDEYLTEHQPLDDYATKEYVDTKIEEFEPGDGIEHVIITEEEFNKLSEEEQNREDVLYLITDAKSVKIDLDNYATREELNTQNGIVSIEAFGIQEGYDVDVEENTRRFQEMIDYCKNEKVICFPAGNFVFKGVNLGEKNNITIKGVSSPFASFAQKDIYTGEIKNNFTRIICDMNPGETFFNHKSCILILEDISFYNLEKNNDGTFSEKESKKNILMQHTRSEDAGKNIEKGKTFCLNCGFFGWKVVFGSDFTMQHLENALGTHKVEEQYEYFKQSCVLASRCRFTRNGIAINQSVDGRITDCSFNKNDYAIVLRENSGFTTISNCRIEWNNFNGIYCEKAHEVTISNCEFDCNGLAGLYAVDNINSNFNGIFRRNGAQVPSQDDESHKEDYTNNIHIYAKGNIHCNFIGSNTTVKAISDVGAAPERPSNCSYFDSNINCIIAYNNLCGCTKNDKEDANKFVDNIDCIIDNNMLINSYTASIPTATIMAKQEYVSVNTSMDDYQLDMKEYFTFTNVNSDNVTWTIEKTSGDIGTLDSSSGILTIDFQTEATAKVTATYNDVSASINIQAVRAAIVCTGLILNKTSLNFTSIGATETIVVTPAPSNTTDTVSWESSDNDVATVTQFGLVTSRGEGTCTLTVTCGDITAECAVTVSLDTDVTISLDKTSITFTEIGETEQITEIISSDEPAEVSWSSTNQAVATVSQTGLVTAVGYGTCKIQVTCRNKIATCDVVVNNSPGSTLEELLLNSTQNVIGGVGNTLNLKAVKIPNNASGTVSWSSSNNDIATVDSQGIVTSKGVGSCNITASCGELSDTCELTVNEVSETLLYDFELDETIFDDVLTSKEYPSIKISVFPTSERYNTVTYLTSKNPAVLGAFRSRYNATEDMEFIPGRNGNALITITCYSTSTNKSVRKEYRAFLDVEDTTEDTAILYNSPEITMEGLKAKATQNGVTQYFDVSYRENDWHPSYAGSIELTNDEGEVFYLAQTKRGTSPFGKNGLHLDSGGGFTEADSSGSGIYDFQASMLYLNNFDMNFKVKNVNNSMDSDYLNKSIEIFNSAFPALNVTVDENAENIIEYCDMNDMSLLGSCWVKPDETTGEYIFDIKINSVKLESKYGGPYSSNTNKKGWYSHSVHEFGHIFGISDNATHLPSLYDYGRPYELCYYLQPNDIAWVEHTHEKTYGVNITTTQEDINQQVQSLDLEEPGEGIEAIYFDYVSFENDCADLVVECNLSYIETKILNSKLKLTYNIFEMSNINILEGEVETNQIKILTYAGLEINESGRYKLYLVKNNNSPYSLINPHEGLIELK